MGGTAGDGVCRVGPSFVPESPAFFVPALAIAFRFTCYYYRGAYYKAVFLSPPSCAIRGAPRRYRGETAPFLFQNLHRYTLYCALFMLVCLWWEAAAAFVFCSASVSAR